MPAFTFPEDKGIIAFHLLRMAPDVARALPEDVLLGLLQTAQKELEAGAYFVHAPVPMNPMPPQKLDVARCVAAVILVSFMVGLLLHWCAIQENNRDAEAALRITNQSIENIERLEGRIRSTGSGR